MVALLGVLLTATGAAEGGEVATLERLWSGVRDSSEQVVMSLERGAAGWPQAGAVRVRTVVAPLKLGWLGAHVLYLEEFLEDDPGAPRRELLIVLEPAAEGARAVRARLYTFADPGGWRHLNHRPALAARLRARDITAAEGCDLTLTRSGEQFRGGTRGQHCLDASTGSARYLDYQLLISAELYWYHRRVLSASDDELEEEVIGFNRFEPNEARLYACRIAWSASGASRELRPLLALELNEAGGRSRFATPDGRSFELTLHGRDWPYAPERDALLLLLQEEGSDAPLATAWAQLDSQRIALQLGWLEIRCGSIAPDSDQLVQ